MAFSNSGRLLKRGTAWIVIGDFRAQGLLIESRSAFQKGVLMKKDRFARPAAVAAGLIFLCAAPGLTRAQSGPPHPAQTAGASSRGAQPKKDSLPADDFAGLNYTDEQKAEIDRIHRDTKSREDAVAKDEKLTADQKEAMLVGYTRIEYGMVYRVLTPEQKRQVQQRIRARHAADQAEKASHSPRN
jgi:Spy/CpxP family protein refolding chaperone